MSTVESVERANREFAVSRREASERGADGAPSHHTGPRLLTALRLARRELRGGLRGFRIFLACLALGVAAIASVQSVSDAVLEGLRNDGRTILGGDIAIRQLYRDVSPEQRQYLENSTAALSHYVELRTMARQATGESSTLVELKGVDNTYPLFGELELTAANSDTAISYNADLLAFDARSGRWGVLIDPALVDRLDVNVGDTLRIGDQDYDIRALIDREPDRLGSGTTFGFWPRVLVSRASLNGAGVLREGSLGYYHYRLRLAQDNAGVAGYRNELATLFPQADWRVWDFNRAAPRVEQFVERLTLFLTLVGLTALLVGGVGVGNAVRAYLDGKLRTIAMLKCIGAPNRTIFQTYLAQLLVLAGVGIAIGLAIGALAPPLVGLLLAGLLPVPVSIGVYPSALLLAALFGLLTTLTFTVWPLAQAHRVPAGALFRAAIDGPGGWPERGYIVLTAVCALALAGLAIGTAINKPLALWFVIGATITLAVFYAAAKLIIALTKRAGRRFSRRPTLRLALANLYRPGAPTPNVVLSLGLGLTVLVAIALIEGNVSRQVRDSLPERAPAYFFVDVQSEQMPAFAADLNAIEGTSELREVPFLRGRLTAVNDQEPSAALVDPEHAWMVRGDRGITYATDIPDNNEVIAGEWWPADYAGPPLVSIHKDMRDAFNLQLGDTVTLNVLGRELKAEVSSVRNLEWESMQMNFLMVFSPQPLAQAPHGFLATIAATPEAEKQIQRLTAADYPNVTAVRVKDALNKVNEVVGSIGTAVRAVAAITLVAGTLVLAGAVAAGHRQRVYDSVVLKVLGATRAKVLKTFLLEYGLLGLLTALIAAVLGTLAAWSVITFVMRGDWQFLPSAVLLTTALCTTITLAFGFIGTWRALGQKSAPLLRNE